MNDLIDRQVAIDAVIKRDANCGIDSAEVLRALPSAQPRWIPFSERMPWAGQQILVCAPDGVMWMTVFRSIIGFCGAWMPLPEPYKGEP